MIGSVSCGRVSILISWLAVFILALTYRLRAFDTISFITQTFSSSGATALLVCLLLINCHACLVALPTISQSDRGTLKFILGLIGICCVKFFFAGSFLMLFFSFELSLVPIFIIIIGWGYQSERVLSRTALFLYTAVGSVPLLLFIIIKLGNGVSSLPTLIIFDSNNLLALSSWAYVAFLTKLPIAGLHMWLPKAHVEAPVVGSMFLAAILLKLGGWGLILYENLINSWLINTLVVRVSLVGITWISLICCQVIDTKILIAFSSVIHIAMVTLGVCLGTSVAFDCVNSVLLSHGFSSSLGFLIVYYFYKIQNSRRLILSKALLSTSGLLRLIWVIAVLALIGCPPAFNLWVEIMCYFIYLPYVSFSAKIFFWAAITGGVYGFTLIAKIYWGSDILYKSALVAPRVELSQGLINALIRVVSVVLLTVLIN